MAYKMNRLSVEKLEKMAIHLLKISNTLQGNPDGKRINMTPKDLVFSMRIWCETTGIALSGGKARILK